MKRSHIIAIVVIAVAIAAIVGSLTETSTYADFAEAYSNPGREYHVVGTLDRSADIIYNPQQDPNLTTFTMLDDKGVRKEVKLLKAKPQDFERSESVVLIGKVENDTFHAKEILMKCPSKYNEQNQIETTL
jgi:cytochrome c-type biogenesis protein CcmE